MSATAVTNAVVKEARYVLTNIGNNNNKFWNIRLFADGSCETHWGRVGEEGQRKSVTGAGEGFFDTKCREKANKGYQPQKTLANTAESAKSMAGDQLAKVAAEQIVTNSPETLKLVTYLAKVNVHRILEATTLTYDESKGTFSTPLGIVTGEGINEARTLLAEISDLVVVGNYTDHAFISRLNQYLMLIPQNIGRAKPDPKALFPDVAAVQKQNGILDSLEASLQNVLAAANGEEKKEVAAPKLFAARLELVEDPKEIDRIRRKYRSTQQSMHACAHLDVKRVFRVRIDAMNDAFEKEGAAIGNVQELWHGTRASNLLSILRSGFVIPAANAPHCTGRMFGNGVYFSDQSTKSLNYAYGYWQGQADDHCFMFLVDVAMGRSYTPKSWQERLPLAGYDSTFAKAGHSGVGNNEMIVYRTCQINPRFLVEFGRSGK
ncbi:MAG: WGR domain-containing protein [Capsulimonadales bacterium]|nr:WGR domain-containing protein [Capsulimonadales bacterium]